MKKLTTFIKDSYSEITHRVTWPKFSELQGSAILVLVASLVFSLLVGFMDVSFENLLKLIYRSA